jgi:hypothetical protein
MKNPKSLIVLALGCATLVSPAFLGAQQDQQSVVDAARKAQAQKKSEKPAKLVVDNDSLDQLKGTINVVGQAPSTDQDKSDGASKPKGSAKDESYWRDKFSEANKKLADDSKELDIAQRERNLNQEQYYANPMATLKQEYSREDLNNQKSKIDDLTAKVAQDKADISSLEDDLRQSGGDPGWANAPSQPAQSSQSGGGSTQSQRPASSDQSAPAAPSTPPANAPAQPPATQSQ